MLLSKKLCKWSHICSEHIEKWYGCSLTGDILK